MVGKKDLLFSVCANWRHTKKKKKRALQSRERARMTFDAVTLRHFNLNVELPDIQEDGSDWLSALTCLQLRSVTRANRACCVSARGSRVSSMPKERKGVGLPPCWCRRCRSALPNRISNMTQYILLFAFLSYRPKRIRQTHSQRKKPKRPVPTCVLGAVCSWD